MITDAEGIEFLQWCLPSLGLRWPGFRRVRRRVYKRLKRRLHELGLTSLNGYRDHLSGHADEWALLNSLCWMPITHFYRDRNVFQQLESEILPELAQLVSAAPQRQLCCWSAGCASGEEPYTLAILWKLRLAARYPALEFRIVATDIDPQAIERAQRACYHWSSLKELPVEWRTTAFAPAGDQLCLREDYRCAVAFHVQDLREILPEGSFQLILCRNLAFTYFDETSQRQTLRKLAAKLSPGGALIIGKLESLPSGESAIAPWSPQLGIYRKALLQAPHLTPTLRT